MDTCPLFVKGVSIEASEDGQIVLKANDAKSIATVQRRVAAYVK